MLCPSCNAFRPANKEPCPRCKAPSPLVRETGGQDSAIWAGPTNPAPWHNQVPQAGYRGETNDNTLWGQVMAPQVPGPGQQPSMLPVPYQGGTGISQQAMSPDLTDIATIHTRAVRNPMAPAIPGEEGPVYVPPMYTKPRAIIPRYRAISGLISLVVVSLLICTGVSYYAKATGKLSFLHQLYGDARPKNVKVTPAIMLPPPQAPVFGTASTIITSATTASSIDKATAQPLTPTNQFQVGDTIYLTYSVHPKTPGTVLVKWYTNTTFYTDELSKPIADATSGYVPIQFQQPVEGMVELYWNNQFAVRLYFVVEPDGS